ncbi:DUF4179 domain-containing protein [Paenibacillus sp. N1-5-1-14]|uniref:DUF4179 domain-containing protein n=1 Tax=Paenibacillus radicibacter TaxID=2972488 RepID=UPI002158EABA|nr:DUF4179 domain-containing protein [Paenibacillus radicibacter]MCR8644971.1 DUF4179 domain-containing protein [Paenibacillus radicibacter]
MSETKQEQQAFQEIRNQYSAIPIPSTIDLHVKLGINQAKKQRNQWKMQMWSAAACVMLIVTFVISVRTSPAIAALVKQIPGMNEIVRMISGDQGLTAALQNDFIQPIGLSDVQDGIQVTVEGIIVDEARMNVFYSVTFPKGQSDHQFSGQPKLTFEDEKDKNLLVSGYGYYRFDDNDPTKFHNTFDVQFEKTSTPFPSQAVFQLETTNSGMTWRIPFTIDVAKFQGLKQTYAIDQTVIIEGQKLTLREATIHPTRITLDVSFDPSNTKQIFDLPDIKIVNEKGETLTSILLGRSGNQATFSFQSNYFTKPKQLFIEGGQAMALEQEQLEVILDPISKKLVKAPEGMALGYYTPTPDGMINVDLAIDMPNAKMNERSMRMLPFPGSVIWDEGKQIISVDRASGSIQDSGKPIAKLINSFQIPNKDYKGNLTFTLSSYPSYINKPFRVQIK